MKIAANESAAAGAFALAGVAAAVLLARFRFLGGSPKVAESYQKWSGEVAPLPAPPDCFQPLENSPLLPV
ncbi:MAG: hypothetical protein WBD23_12045 [Candidatus Acidiferrales bacterium]